LVLELTENAATVTLLRHIDHNENQPFLAIYESDTLTGHTKTKPVGSLSVCTFPKPENVPPSFEKRLLDNQRR
jgi:hypothetical protein